MEISYPELVIARVPEIGFESLAESAVTSASGARRASPPPAGIISSTGSAGASPELAPGLATEGRVDEAGDLGGPPSRGPIGG